LCPPLLELLSLSEGCHFGLRVIFRSFFCWLARYVFLDELEPYPYALFFLFLVGLRASSCSVAFTGAHFLSISLLRSNTRAGNWSVTSVLFQPPSSLRGFLITLSSQPFSLFWDGVAMILRSLCSCLAYMRDCF